MIDGWGRGRGDGGGGGGGGGVEGVERLNVSTWLVIQSDYHRLTAPNGRHPRLLSLPSLHCLSRVRESESQRGGGGAGRLPVCVCVCVCVCVYVREMSQQWMGLRQTQPAPTLTSPELPRVQGAHPGCSVQDDPLRGGDSWWKLQPAELRLDAGRQEECKLSI